VVLGECVFLIYLKYCRVFSCDCMVFDWLDVVCRFWEILKGDGVLIFR